MTELKKCPFCGGEAEIRITEWDNSSKTHYSVMCQKCESETTLYKTEAEAIAAWNKRAKDENTLTLDEIREVVFKAIDNNCNGISLLMWEFEKACKASNLVEFIEKACKASNLVEFIEKEKKGD